MISDTIMYSMNSFRSGNKATSFYLYIYTKKAVFDNLKEGTHKKIS